LSCAPPCCALYFSRRSVVVREPIDPTPNRGVCCDQWSAPILLALKQAHQVLLTDFGCHEWSINGPASASAVPQIEDSSPNPAANAPQSASCNVVPPLTLLPLPLLYSTQTVYSNLDDNTKVPSVPAQRVITAHVMRLWPSHQYVLGDISLTRSEQTLRATELSTFQGLPCRSR